MAGVDTVQVEAFREVMRADAEERRAQLEAMDPGRHFAMIAL